MARLVLVLDVTAEPNLWDPHEVIEDILAHSDKLTDVQEGTFVSCEWEEATP